MDPDETEHDKWAFDLWWDTWFPEVLQECREGECYCALALALAPALALALAQALALALPTWFPEVLKESREGECYCALALALVLLDSLGCSRNPGRVSVTVS